MGEEKDQRQVWYDPTRQPLPYARETKIYCFYGTGNPTERAYYYRRNLQDAVGGTDNHDNDVRLLGDPSIVLDAAMKDDGIRYSDGDGSVPLISLGYICADAWQRPDSGLNPSGAEVYTREYRHRAEFQVDDPMRGGPASSDHVDILGNAAMIEDFLKVVTGFETDDVQEDHIVSRIREISAAINSHPMGGLKRKKNHRWL